ncbi:hypothetical protein ABEB36_009302 [Hypothenemus hampei]|uniref:Transposable element P transposase n=1 Tax=Hypothenemus hampei TaxID=57062 RepID=A0ABD1EG61_HYPHA
MQLVKLNGSNKKLKWTAEDMSNAIVIYSAGPRAYRLLLKRGYPYPAVSTIKSWLAKIKISPGIIKNIFNIISHTEMTPLQKVCVIAFDEMKIRSVYEYDRVTDTTMKPSNYVQIVLLRGLFENWKQPIFFEYDFQMTTEKFFEIILFVEQLGFQVVACVSDLGGGNRGFFRGLNVTPEQPFFINPANKEKVFVIADVPHLIKLIRNHFVDKDATCSSDLRMTYKITKETLNVTGPGRQKVKLATKLFSNTISAAIIRSGTLDDLQCDFWFECAEFFKLVNDWFDVLNSRTLVSDTRDRLKPYGLKLESQNHILDSMTATIKNMRVIGRTTLLPFQKGVIMTNTSVQLLFKDLQRRFSTKYILTYRLNQDVIKNFFGVIRANGGLHDHPSALEVKYRIRKYIFGRNEGSLSSMGNTEDDQTPSLPTESNLTGHLFL